MKQINDVFDAQRTLERLQAGKMSQIEVKEAQADVRAVMDTDDFTTANGQDLLRQINTVAIKNLLAMEDGAPTTHPVEILAGSSNKQLLAEQRDFLNILRHPGEYPQETINNANKRLTNLSAEIVHRREVGSMPLPAGREDKPFTDTTSSDVLMGQDSGVPEPMSSLDKNFFNDGPEAA